MSTINPKLSKDLKKFGGFDFNACYNCGNCTAICNLSDEHNSFPREMVRFSVLGLQEDIKSSLKPWLCYYCGDCTTLCPQSASPAELMMTLRRWLTSTYDWTKLSGLFYKSVIANLLAFVLIAVGVVAFAGYEKFQAIPVMHVGHLFEMVAIGGVFLVILIPNILRMWYYTTGSGKLKFNLKNYIITANELFIHMFTQKQTRICDASKENTIWWFEHLILVIGYLMLLFVTVFLDWFGTQSNLVIYAGYVFSSIIFVVTFDFVIRRLRKRTEKSTFSHFSDWFFVIWLFLMGISAFAVRLLIDTGSLENHFWVYLVHLTILVQWALIIVPFGKWTHFLYRSFAMYFSAVMDKTKKTAA